MFSIYNIRFLDIMIGQQLIITEEIQFSEPSYLCNVGSIVFGNSCGKLLKKDNLKNI